MGIFVNLYTIYSSLVGAQIRVTGLFKAVRTSESVLTSLKDKVVVQYVLQITKLGEIYTYLTNVCTYLR